MIINHYKGDLMRDRLLWIPYSKQIYPSNKRFFLFSILLSLLLFYLVHAAIFLSNKSILDDHADHVLFQAEQLDFQIKHATSQAMQSAFDPCAENDLIELRKILDTYYFLGDIGRVQGKQVICTVKKGKLTAPLTLGGRSYQSASDIHYWNNQNQLIFDANKAPTFTHGNVVAFLSPIFLLEMPTTIKTRNGSGGYLYLKDSEYVVKVYDKVLEFDDVRKTLNNQPSWYDWALLPDAVINTNRCGKGSDICLMTIAKSVGVSSLSYYFIILIGLCSLAAGTLLAYFLVLRRGSVTFFKRLRKAIRKQNIYPVYQPKVRLRDDKKIGVEVLARWDDELLGFVKPDLFIAIAEQTNLIRNLTEQLIKRVFVELKDILEANPDFTVSINVTASLLEDTAFLSFLNTEVARYRFEKQQVIIEVTERTTSNSEDMAAASTLVKSYGYLVSLDDFGTGFSNLSWLTTFEPDEIKVDKMFTESINTESVNNITLDGMFSMIDRLNVSVVFEGIEEESELAFIKQRVPDATGQGWLFSKPLLISDLILYLDNNNQQNSFSVLKSLASG